MVAREVIVHPQGQILIECVETVMTSSSQIYGFLLLQLLPRGHQWISPHYLQVSYSRAPRQEARLAVSCEIAMPLSCVQFFTNDKIVLALVLFPHLCAASQTPSKGRDETRGPIEAGPVNLLEFDLLRTLVQDSTL